MFSTEIYLSTFIYISLFTTLLFIGIINSIQKWKKPDRNYYLKYTALWASGLVYNLVEGLLPDPNFSIAIMPQNIVAWTVGISVAYHFLVFIKKEYQVEFHKKNIPLNTVGMVSLLLFVLLFILPYTITKSIDQSRVFFVSFFLIALSVANLFFVNQLYKRIKAEENIYLKVHSFNGIMGFLGLFSLPFTIIIFGDNQFIEQSFFSLGIFFVTVDYFFYHKRKEEFKKAISFENLTNRETEILKMILENPELKYAQISDQLNISEKTLSTHLSNIYKKTDLTSKKDIEELSEGLRRSIVA
ncbi:helix-turn-helix domain-containing protein [Chryseobacterium turcicum]|uniref:Helix-turn-helix transcriptional regulator n=1 Tax=Chryseobacterium turcicum TaxID=2898076 RepID=A0A9Q3V7Q7_9FLAO|nr:helix-turn-helix transcriptional regulator [Chryseobacterium turcicum]MCD1119164.1 helix-turn-helix transcriptional regulator [Chryseobacterium turcicum]